MRILLHFNGLVLAIRAASLTILLFLAACGSRSQSRPHLLDALRAVQQTNHIVIGLKEGAALDYFDAFAEGAYRRAYLPVVPRVSRSIDLRGVSGAVNTSDGKWTASCDGSSICLISEAGDPHRRLTVSRKEIGRAHV